MSDNLKLYLFLIKTALLAVNPLTGALRDPDMTLTLAAKYLLAEFDRNDLPDWLEALANANLELWSAAVDEIRSLLKAEEV